VEQRTSAIQERSVKKIYTVQYLRACAALLVLLAHVFSYQIGDRNPFSGLTGHLGVMLFFVISGFIMVYISGSGPFSALIFLKRRAIRIVPLYWLFTSFAALMAALIPSLFKNTVFTWPHFIKSLFFIVHEAPGTGSLSPLLSLGWTLNYEVYFYIVFAMVAFLSLAPRVIFLTVFFIGAWSIGMLSAPADPVFQFYLNASPLAFLAGTLIGWLSLHGWLTPSSLRIWVLGLLAALGLAMALGDNGIPLGQVGFAGQVILAASLLLLGLMLEPKLARWSLLEQLGDASYALYLSHIFVVGAVVHVVRRITGSDGTVATMLAAVISIVVACAASVVIHKVIEKPMLRLFTRKTKAAGTTFPLAVAEANKRP
jgi:exopolysaccharide production protein ExoZ